MTDHIHVVQSGVFGEEDLAVLALANLVSELVLVYHLSPRCWNLAGVGLMGHNDPLVLAESVDGVHAVPEVGWPVARAGCDGGGHSLIYTEDSRQNGRDEEDRQGGERWERERGGILAKTPQRGTPARV